MKVRGDDYLEGAHLLYHFWGESHSFRATFWEHLQNSVLYPGLEYNLSCRAAMKVRGDDHLEGAHSLYHFLRESPPFCATFWEHLQS